MRNDSYPVLGLFICVLFFISGATSLIYEVVWTRFFIVSYGNTTFGISAVLTAFMAGLGLGSYVFGRIIDKKQDYLFIYALLELGIAIIALLMPHITSMLQAIYADIFHAFPDSIWLLQFIRVLISFCILVLPTFLMGATLPVITRFFISRNEQIGARIGILYGANTLGATIGCFLTGFILIKSFGLENTVYIAAALNIVLAVTFLLIRQFTHHAYSNNGQHDQEQELYDTPGVQEPAIDSSRLRLLLFCFGLAGFTSLAYEVLWFRLLVFNLQTSIYAFTVMLTTFLAGIGLGSAIYATIQKKGTTKARLWENFGFIEAAIGLFGLMSIMMFGVLEYLGNIIVGTFWQHVGIQFITASLIMLLPTLLMGASFPVVTRIISTDIRQLGGSVGSVYAVNTLGAIFGSFLTGFFMVRLLGTQNSLLLIGIINIIIASALLLSVPKEKKEDLSAGSSQGSGYIQIFRGSGNNALVAGLWMLALIGIITIPRNYLFEYYNSFEEIFDSQVKILYANEGLEAITTVHQYPNNTRVISTGSINVAGTSFTLRTTQILQAHIPMLLHPDAKTVLQIGFGSGETAHLITTYDNIDRLDLVDINAAVLETSSMYFSDINNDVVNHKKFHPVIMDGANYLRLTNKKYDVIMNDSIWPFYAGNSGLYTRDYFMAGKQRLNKGGFMTSWLPVEIAREDFDILLNTFHSVFPHVTVWMAVTHYNRHALIVGSEEKINIDVTRFIQRFEQYALDDLKIVKLDNPVNLLDTFKMDQSAFSEEINNNPIHTENRPILEFSLSRGKPAKGMFDVYEYIYANNTNPSAYLLNIPGTDDQQEQFREDVLAANAASRYVMSGLIKQENFNNTFADDFKQALAIWPQHSGARRLLANIEKREPITRDTLVNKSYIDLRRLGAQLIKDADLENAVPVIKQMITLRPDFADLRVDLGNTYLKQGRYLDAITAYKAAMSLGSEIDLSRSLAIAHNKYGNNLLANPKTIASAEGEFSAAIELMPDYTEAHHNYGVLLTRLGRYDEAVERFTDTIRLEPQNEGAHNNLGIIFARTGKFETAVEHFKKAILIQPQFSQAHENLAFAYFYQQKYVEAWNKVHHMQQLGVPVKTDFITALKAKMAEP